MTDESGEHVVSLDAALYARLSLIAASRGLSVEQVVTDALEAAVLE